MSGVPGQQDPALPVPGHLPFLAVEPRGPPWIVHAVIGAQGLAGHLADLIQADRRALGWLVAAVPGDDQGLADGAVHPVGAHDPACAHHLVPVAVPADGHFCPIGVLDEPGDLAAVTDIRAQSRRPFFQHPLGLVLRGDQQVREPAWQAGQVQRRASQEPELTATPTSTSISSSSSPDWR